MIYWKANRTIVWLGQGDSDTDICLRAIDDIVRKSRSVSASSTHGLTDFNSAENFQNLVKGVELCDRRRALSTEYLSLARFFDRPWFERIWVIQEVTECRFANVMVGNDELPWQSIGLVAAWIVTQYEGAEVLRHSETRGVHNVLFMCKKDFWTGSSVPHLDVLQSTRNFHATDLRDKVYAMLNQSLIMPEDHYFTFQISSQGIWSLWSISRCFCSAALTAVTWRFFGMFNPMDWHGLKTFLLVISYQLSYQILKKLPPWQPARVHKQAPADFSPKEHWVSTTVSDLLKMEPDYTVPSIEEVNKSVAMQTVTNFARVDFLSYVHHGTLIDETTASWVPKWQQYTGNKHILASFIQDPYVADTGQALRQHSKPFVKEDRLNVKAVQIGSVSQVSKTMHAADFNLKNPPIVERLLEEHGRITNIYGPTRIDAKLACILTLTASQKVPGLRTSETSDLERFDTFLYLGMTSTINHNPADSGYALLSEENHNAARRVCHLRKHFVTPSGYQGLGPAQTEPNDIVFVIFGGCCPYVLREVQPSLYRLVGECYVHGLMDGEAIAEWKSGRLSRQTIALC
jgi:hypothetical protein